MRALLFLGLAVALAVASPARADLEHDAPPGSCGVDSIDHGVARVHGCLIADGTHIGVRLRMSPHWHVYWRNPGGGALSTEVAWSPAAATNWPVPTRIVRGGGIITLYGYENEVTLWTTLPTADDTVDAVVDYLVCDVDCIPGTLRLHRALPATDASDPEVRAAFELAIRHTPRPPSELGLSVVHHVTPSVVVPSSTFDVSFTIARAGEDAGFAGPLAPPPDGIASAYFPDLTRSVEWTATTLTPTTAGAVLVVRGTAGPDDPGSNQPAGGVIALRASDGRDVLLNTDFTLPRHRTAATLAPASSHRSRRLPVPSSTPPFWLALLFALLGGLLLNLMPCVLPVLVVKVASFTRLADETRRARSLHVAAYALGIEAAMLGLAGFVIVLRSAGVAVGWGFQFQEPDFLAAASTLLVVLALGLFGVYTLVPPLATDATKRVGSLRAGLGRSAAEGVLAVLLATPCSAPLLGTAVGFALAGSSLRIALVFLAIGGGLAVPFAVVALVPGARRLVPKPGAWMVALERVVGFALLATVVWLAWVLGELAGAEAMGRLLGFLVAASVATWVIASTRAAGRVGRVVGLVLPLVLMPVIGLHVLQFRPAAAPAATADAWSDAAVDRALAGGHPVLVDFTADWCITCKVNERTVLASADVRRALRETDAVTLRADWTRRDESIRRVLADHGKAGVPMYLVYAPARPAAPEMLPELITPGLVVGALHRAALPSR